MRFNDVTVVIPTINEDESIGRLIKLLTSNHQKMSVIVVDDGSTDKTKLIVTGLGSKNKRVRFYDRKMIGLPKGLTNSMIDGLNLSKTKYVIFMDADFQHPVYLLPKILTQLENGNNMVIAVRAKVYNQILYRHIISSLFSTIGSLILASNQSPTSKDIFSGYFGLERTFAKRKIKINRKRFVGYGYKFLFDLLKSTSLNEVRKAEIPYTFKARRYGSSKATFKQGVALLKSFVT